MQSAGIGVGLQVLGLVLSFGSGVLAARLLGPAGLGQYAYALAVMGAASIPAALGFPTALVRFLPVYRTGDEWGLARGVLRRSNLLAGTLATALAVGVVVVAGIAATGSRMLTFWVAAPLIPLLVWTNLRQKALQGLHHPVAAQLPEQLVKPFVFVVLGGLAWAANARFGRLPQGLMLLWLVASTAAFVLGATLLRRLSPAALGAADPKYATREWLAVSLPLLVVDGFGVIYSATDTILLGALRPAAEVGLYQVANRTAALIGLFLVASNWVLAPWFAQLHATAERERLQRMVTKTVRGVSSLSLLVFCLFALWGKSLLSTFFGSGYAPAYNVLLILAVARLVNVSAGPVINLLAMTGGQKVLAWVIGVAALANVLGCWFLIPPFGMYGAAAVTAFAMVSTNVALSVAIRRRTGVRTTALG